MFGFALWTPVQVSDVHQEPKKNRVPYFVSAALADNAPPDAGDDWMPLSIVGLLIHVGTWIAILGLDLYLLAFTFNGNADTMLHLLQVAATVPLCIAAGVVFVCGALHIFIDGIDFNRNLLAPFLASAIASNIRATLEFSKFLLFFSIFQPVVGVQGDNQVPYATKQILIALVVLKYYGISMTMNQHRRKVYDDTHSGTSVPLI